MDRVEQRILEHLQVDGRMSNVQLAEIVGLSESPTFRRVKLLEEAGTIRGYVALLDQRKLGLQVTAYVSVRMEKQPDRDRHGFHRRVADEPYIVECHAMSGAFDFLMKVVARDMDHFAELCMQEILNFPGVAHVESSFSLKAIKSSHALPVDASSA
jgi:Lrp/AsnC family leucine-responsive transcriptional regulator